MLGEKRVMKFYSYVIPRDYGFAPNPYFNYCTLATCKPRIRKTAQIGDWIGAFGSARMTICGKLVFLMRVEEILTFDEYWSDWRFRSKHPVFTRSIMYMYGDNIYHHLGNRWMQEPSHHSNMDGSINYVNLNNDTQTDRVLIATEFYYFGENAIIVPEEFNSLIWNRRNHKVCDDEMLISIFVDFIRQNYSVGIHGIPYSRREGAFIHYGGK